MEGQRAWLPAGLQSPESRGRARVEKGTWERGPQAALGPKGAAAKGLVRGGDRTSPAWQPRAQVASGQHAARKKHRPSGSSGLSQGTYPRCA